MKGYRANIPMVVEQTHRGETLLPPLMSAEEATAYGLIDGILVR
jgi:hypothetical protein